MRVGHIMKKQGNVKRLLYHEEVNFPSAPNQTTLWKWRWRHHWSVMAIVQDRFSKQVPFKGEGRKRYKKLVLGLVRKGKKGGWNIIVLPLSILIIIF
jgi:hypothetical protein